MERPDTEMSTDSVSGNKGWKVLSIYYLKVHYATFLRAVTKQKNRVPDTRNSSL